MHESADGSAKLRGQKVRGTIVAGVIGYIEQTSIPAAIAPSPIAWLPFI